MILVLLTIILFTAFAAVLIIALVTGRKKLFPIAIGLFIATAILGGLGVSRVMKKATTAFSNIEPRTGEEMYKQSFSYGALACVKVINTRDRADLLRDCCTWMEFETCPREVDRVLESRQHSSIKLNIEKVRALLPVIPSRPDWWRPDTLDDSVLIINFELPVPGNYGIEQKMFLSADSTRGYYFEKVETVFKSDSTDN